MAKQTDKTPKTPGRRGRRSLSAADKQAMSEARTRAAQNRKVLLEAVTNSEDVLKPKFWNKLDTERQLAIRTAIDGSLEATKNEQIAKLEAQLAALKGTPATAEAPQA